MPRLTKRLIAATEPGAHDIILRDDALPGFHCRIRKGGSKTFFLYYRTQAGKERRLKIARCDEMVPERAREIARDKLELVRRGGDPAVDRDTARASEPAETFKAAVEDYIKREQEGRKRNATAPEVKRALLRECAAWAKRPVPSITGADVRKRVEEIRDGDPTKGVRPRPYLANRVHAYLRTFFTWCAANGIDKIPASPMVGIKRPWEGEEERDRVFSDDELRALWRAADGFATDTTMRTGAAAGAFLKVMLLTGKRRGALASMRWDELEGGLWAPSRRRRGNKRLHPIPLPKLAMRIINGLPRKEGNPYVFAGRVHGKPLDPGTPLMKDIRKASGVADFFFHACRHTVETRLAVLRVPPHLRDLILDHVPVRGSGKGYDHHEYEDEMREALEKWAVHLEELISTR